MSEDKQYYTIQQYFKSVIDNNEIRIFHFVWDGDITGATKTRKHARVTIAIPTDIATTNIKPILEDWKFFGVAIPRSLIKELLRKEVKKK